ncbi:transcriptional regulator, TetR family [Pseudonocardia thermophila]|jgi:Transcriptional regulator|uniref:Transcriptional regulator, TetR family n=1 Tax=Pseudonocardia thermophila TaxID=1848 RepID=A0A1M6U0S1_PSETH|nr:TetR/AcrR family transcriptional regulator [Pseudonocardia thermophila]SHK62797.1 transcriptional regulator, TetR family [Pseudonocardia thermophila]
MVAHPPRRMSPQRRREHLIEATLELFATVGPEQVGVREITRAADVSRALFYRYFSGIEELRVAALSAIVRELGASIADPVGATPLDQLRSAVNAFLDVAEKHAKAYVALLRSGSVVASGDTAALVDGVREQIVRLVVERSGVPAPSPLFLMTVRGWVALAESATVSWQQDRSVPRDQLVEWLVGQLRAMLAENARHEQVPAVSF